MKLQECLESIRNIETQYYTEQNQLYSYNQQLQALNEEIVLQERAKIALQQVFSLLAADNIEYCMNLCNLAIEHIFQRDDIEGVEFDLAKQAFILCYSNGLKTDIATAESGGMMSIVSVILTIFLITSLGHRRLLVMDEQFTGISSNYIENFYYFLKKLAKDLDMNLLMITHDKRITPDMVDSILEVKDGTVLKI
jgi:ABC-type branched-subunit amino acid transport system ATPase component